MYEKCDRDRLPSLMFQHHFAMTPKRGGLPRHARLMALNARTRRLANSWSNASGRCCTALNFSSSARSMSAG
ncbi:LysR family transcriptional regulator [Ralstonia solanacearum]|nr:LysR family transcriptional regulator [Ralstonia solanacearum]